MNFVRHYVMRAHRGGGDALAAALTGLRAAVAGLPGSQGVTLMRDRTDGDRFVFIERWDAEAAWKAAAAGLPPALMAEVRDALGAPLEGAGLDLLAG